jgi:hypothetical protein
VGDRADERVEVAHVVLVVGLIELRHAADRGLRIGTDGRERGRWQVVRGLVVEA